jgi:hypothetical protein
VVDLILQVLASQRVDEPPMRNRDGKLVQRRVRKAKAMHAFGRSAANGEDAKGEDTRLPPPDQHLLTELDEIDTARLIEKYIEYTDGERSAHLPSVFVPPVVKGLPDDLPVVDAIATLPLVLPNGAWLAGPGLDRDYGILFKIEPGIQRLLPRPEECNSDRVPKLSASAGDGNHVTVARQQPVQGDLADAGVVREGNIGETHQQRFRSHAVRRLREATGRKGKIRD